MDKKTYGGIDIAKFIFACLIPLLHIPFDNNQILYIIRQYIARLGVPFFFAVAGMMLDSSIAIRGAKAACIRYMKRIGIMLLAWLIIYSPILYVRLRNEHRLIQILLFKTPAYLWYLTALIVAVIPFCLVRNKKLLIIVGGILYIFGTIFGGSYSWWSGGLPLYESVFLTTRNGIFFGIPLLCIGKLVTMKIFKNKSTVIWGNIISTIFLFIEITFAQKHMLPDADCSMYFFIPVQIYFLLELLVQIEVDFDTVPFRKMSSSIYVAQFGVIFVFTKIISYTGFVGNLWWFITWLMIIATGWIIYVVVCRFSILRFLI